MKNGRLTLIMVCFILAGVLFILAGLYFSSKKYQKSLADSHDNADEKTKAVTMGKLCGIISLALGGITVVSGIAIKIVPELFRYLSLFYVLALIACFASLIFSLKDKK